MFINKIINLYNLPMHRITTSTNDVISMMVGTSGVHEGIAFCVVGKVQLHYSTGIWNHWYLRFDDGGDGWLSEADYLITVTRERRVSIEHLPSFEEIELGSIQLLHNQKYWVAERRIAKFVAREGELAYPFSTDAKVRVLTLRNKQHYALVDYSPTDTRVFVGAAYPDWNSLQLKNSEHPLIPNWSGQNVTSDHLTCPRCGHVVLLYSEQASTVFCQSCCACLSLADKKLELVSTLPIVQQLSTPLKLGDQCTLNGFKYEVVGIQSRHDLLVRRQRNPPKDELFSYEYCLVTPNKPPVYLTQDGSNSASTKWELAEPWDGWPDKSPYESTVYLSNKMYFFFDMSEYQITHAAGDFNQELDSKNSITVEQYRTDNKKEKIQTRKTKDRFDWYVVTSFKTHQVSELFNKKIVFPKLKETLFFFLASLLAALLTAYLNWDHLQKLQQGIYNRAQYAYPMLFICFSIWIPWLVRYALESTKIYFSLTWESNRKRNFLRIINVVYLIVVIVGTSIFFNSYKP